LRSENGGATIFRNRVRASSERKIAFTMQPSLDEAPHPPQEPDTMSAKTPPDPLGDRPRMAEALASLKEGLRDTADPLYDGWKRRPRVPVDKPAIGGSSNGAAVASLAHGARVPPIVPRFRSHSAEDPGITIDLSRDGTPDETPIDEVDVPIDEDLGGDTEASLAAEQSFFWVPTNEMGSAPPVVSQQTSVQPDTVRVRVIRYPTFPRWALILVAAFMVFAGSLLVLRPTTTGDLNEPTDESAAETASAPTVAAAELPPRGTPAAEVIAVDPVAAPAEEPPAPPEDDALVAADFDKGDPPSPVIAPHRRVMGRPAVAPAASTAQGRMPAPPNRRRSGSRDFFRDPGF
jgi:hypothetical protein